MPPRRRPVPAACRSVSITAAALVAALLLAGCSSSTSATATSSSPAAITSATTRSAETFDAAPSVAAPSVPGSAGDATITSTSSAGDKTPAEPAECASIAQKYGAIISATLPILQGKTGPAPFDADGLAKAVDASTMGTIPAELEPDFATFKNAAQQLVGKDLSAAAEVINGAEITKATSNIDQFLSDHC